MTTPRSRLSRRRSVASSAGVAAVVAAPLAAAAPQAATAETLAAQFHSSLSDAQRSRICFPWDDRHPKFGLLRTRVGDNWNATEPDWIPRFDRQLEDDAGGFGHAQSIALIRGPAFVWHFRGGPHVHVWVNVADTPTVAANA